MKAREKRSNKEKKVEKVRTNVVIIIIELSQHSKQYCSLIICLKLARIMDMYIFFAEK